LRLEALEGRWVPTTLTPTTFLDGGPGSGSLRDAVLQFNADTGTADDIIQLEAGTYALTIPNIGGRHETAGLTGDLNLTQTSHRWIIQGAGPSTIIDASQLQDRVFQIVNPGTQVVFQDLVIQGGLAQDDGADGAQAGTTDSLGGGILNNGGNLTLDDVVVQNNLVRGGDVVTLSTPGHNGIGGGIYSTGGALSITGATLANNQASGGRGGDHNGFQQAGNGGSGVGGGLYAGGGSLDISDSMVASNRATGGRGGNGSFSFSGTRNGGNGGAGHGGGLYVDGGSLTVASSTIASNQGTGGSGGGYGYGGDGAGAGIFNDGTLTVTGSTLSGNSALGVDVVGQGGGIYNYPLRTLTVSNSTLSANSSSWDGGGIENDSGTVTVSDSTLSGNSAAGGGGGIFSRISLTLTNVTLTVNRANVAGGGLDVASSSVLLHNTLIAGNFRGIGTTHDDVYGPLAPSGDYNLIGAGSGMTGLSDGVNGNQVGSTSANIDPLLGPLDDNGGPTLTHALLSSSPAIDAGNNAYATDWDQRGPGFRRVVNGTIDIGAFEVQAHAHGRPTGQPLPDPVAVEPLQGGPLVGQPPDLPATPSPVPELGLPDGQTVQPEPVPLPTAGGQQAPATLLGTDPGTGQPVASLGSLSANDLDALALNLLGGP
jgi:hypothetical protein